VPSTVIHSGERKPREYFHLTQPDGAPWH
jgi:hypothetical protein